MVGTIDNRLQLPSSSLLQTKTVTNSPSSQDPLQNGTNYHRIFATHQLLVFLRVNFKLWIWVTSSGGLTSCKSLLLSHLHVRVHPDRRYVEIVQYTTRTGVWCEHFNVHQVLIYVCILNINK